MPGAGEIEVFSVQRRRRFSAEEKQRRRRFSAEEKQRLVEQTFQPGMNVSLVAREHRISPSLLFRWRKLSSQGSLQAVGADESVVPASEYKALQQQVRELQRLLGKKTLENEILKEATEVAREKKWLVRSS
jgi:transposase